MGWFLLLSNAAFAFYFNSNALVEILNEPTASMKKIFQLTTLVAIALTSMFVSSCATTPPPPSRSNVSTTYVKKPRINIQNNSYRSIVVGVEGPERRFITVPARSNRVVYLKSGVYKYAAAAKNTRTISGYKAFSANRRYTWNFGVN